MKLENVKTGAIRLATKTKLKIQKYSPEILIGVGVVAIVGGTVLACKATLKADEVLDDHAEAMDRLDVAREINSDEYSEEDKKKDTTIVYIQTGWRFTKLYAPAALCTLGGIACILAAHNIMQKRQLALMAAYTAVDQAFKDYRKRVTDELGEEKDRQFMYGADKPVKKAIDEKTGEVIDAKEEQIPKIGDIQPSVYARFFDESSTEWTKNAETNLMKIHSQQSYANYMLQTRGVVFLNEVYDMLGLPPSQAGQIVGWTKDVTEYIDFGIYHVDAHGTHKDFVNGYERSILLDFNVEGPILDKI